MDVMEGTVARRKTNQGPSERARILVIGLNYSPEQVGIGPYTASMANYFANKGYYVEAIAGLPYYPEWRGRLGYGLSRYSRMAENGVLVTRCPLYVPAKPTGAKRIIHHLSFALSIIWPLTRIFFSARRPDLVAVIAPSMMSAPVACLFANLFRARKWLHVQDFEVGAAVATGLINRKSLTGRAASLFQKFAYRGFDLYTSISPQMCETFHRQGVSRHQIFELRNWGDTDSIVPIDTYQSSYRRRLGVTTPHVALYSGVISHKQGLEIVIEAARALQRRDDVTFLICGSGPMRQSLEAAAADLTNIRFIDLQPRAELGDLLGLATIHLLPQLADAADLVLPSKLSNMLASGKPVVATAERATGLAAEVQGSGVVVLPGNCTGMVEAIEMLVDSPDVYRRLALHARDRAMQRWSRTNILAGLCGRLAPLLPNDQGAARPYTDGPSPGISENQGKSAR